MATQWPDSPTQARPRTPNSLPQKLAGIEAGRGVAALLVLCYHASSHLVKAYGDFPGSAVFSFMHAGVDFFFVISGFIILRVHGGDIGRPQTLKHYFRKRFVRIYPLLWVVLAVSLALGAVHHDLPAARDIVSAALLLPIPEDIVGPAWTLHHEIIFYAAFAVLIANANAGRLVFLAWASLIGLGLAGVSTQLQDWIVPSSSFDAEFFLGMMCARWTGGSPARAPLATLAGGCAIFVGCGCLEDLAVVGNASDWLHLGYGLGSALIVVGLVDLERQGRLGVPGLLVRLGGASYSIYLIHLIAIGVIWQALVRTHLAAQLSVWVELALFVGLAPVAGYLVSMVIERPIMRLLGSARRSAAVAG